MAVSNKQVLLNHCIPSCVRRCQLSAYISSDPYVIQSLVLPLDRLNANFFAFCAMLAHAIFRFPPAWRHKFSIDCLPKSKIKPKPTIAMKFHTVAVAAVGLVAAAAPSVLASHGEYADNPNRYRHRRQQEQEGLLGVCLRGRLPVRRPVLWTYVHRHHRLRP